MNDEGADRRGDGGSGTAEAERRRRAGSLLERIDAGEPAGTPEPRAGGERVDWDGDAKAGTAEGQEDRQEGGRRGRGTPETPWWARGGGAEGEDEEGEVPWGSAGVVARRPRPVLEGRAPGEGEADAEGTDGAGKLGAGRAATRGGRRSEAASAEALVRATGVLDGDDVVGLQAALGEGPADAGEPGTGDRSWEDGTPAATGGSGGLARPGLASRGGAGGREERAGGGVHGGPNGGGSAAVRKGGARGGDAGRGRVVQLRSVVLGVVGIGGVVAGTIVAGARLLPAANAWWTTRARRTAEGVVVGPVARATDRIVCKPGFVRLRDQVPAAAQLAGVIAGRVRMPRDPRYLSQVGAMSAVLADGDRLDLFRPPGARIVVRYRRGSVEVRTVSVAFERQVGLCRALQLTGVLQQELEVRVDSTGYVVPTGGDAGERYAWGGAVRMKGNPEDVGALQLERDAWGTETGTGTGRAEAAEGRRGGRRDAASRRREAESDGAPRRR